MITYNGKLKTGWVTFNAKVRLNDVDYDKRLNRAQYWLDNQIFNDTEAYMPQKTNALRNVTRAENSSVAGTGKVVVAAGPYGRFLYEGKVMVDPVTNSPWARKDAKKVVTENDLTYSNPLTKPHWFDVAKKNHMKGWIEGVDKILNGR